MMPLSARERSRIREAMLGVGAVSPATAKPKRDLPEGIREQLDWYVQDGIIREGAPRTYYLFDPPPMRPPARRLVAVILFWLAVILVPVTIIYFTGK